MRERLIAIAREAGELFKEGYLGAKQTRFKAAVDLVTEYDLAVEKQVAAALREAFPGYRIVGEEGSADAVDVDAEKAIYIDPIDGTTNFVHGIPFCCISIGVWEQGRGVAGVVYAPMLDELFVAEAGKGATLNGKPISVSDDELLLHALIATGFPYTKVERGADYEFVMERLGRVLPVTRDIRRLGAAALDLCYVAQGKFGGFYEINLQPWDVAAGLVILQEAGGLALNEQSRPSGAHDRLVVAGNPTIANALSALLK